MDRKDWRVMQFLAPRFKHSLNKETNEFYIQGKAIHATTTRNGTIFTVEELDKSAHSLEGKPLLKDHINSVDSIIGRVVAAKWSPAHNAILFKARVTDKVARENIENGNIQNVSVGAMVEDVEELEENGVYTYMLKGITFLELSTVAIPADPDAGFGMAQAVLAAFGKKIEAKKPVLLTATATTQGTTTFPYVAKTSTQTITGGFGIITTQIVKETPKDSPTRVEEAVSDNKTQEEPEMENSNPNDVALANVLSKVSETLGAVTERLAKIEEKVNAAPAAPVAENKPESKGRVSASAETENLSDKHFQIERRGESTSVSFHKYDAGLFPNLAGKRA